LTVQTADGNEAYTRAGNLHIDQNGQLVNATNLPVLGTGGPISVPPGAQITIGKDGTISALAPGDPASAIAVVDQLKLVKPAAGSLTRGDDGMFRTADGNPADADPSVTLAPESLEGSNVNPVNAMVSMITNARQFQMQTKMIESADQNDQTANQLLSFS
jgi:flagellar basal-body rod protein FlgF